MNELHPSDTMAFDDDARFDRLVDGEASPEEYRTILAGLDDEPGGWRRCAMAFLEAQALACELGDLREEAVFAASQQTAAKPGVASESGAATNYWPLALAMAASFLAAFGLGYAWRSAGQGNQQQPELIVEENQPPPQDSQLAGNPSTNRETGPLREEHVVHPPLQNVTLVVGDDAANAEQFEIPVVHYGDVGDEYFQAEHTAMPPQIREMLERQGHQLRRTQGYVPVTLEDGQQLVVPVEEVEIVPVGWPAF